MTTQDTANAVADPDRAPAFEVHVAAGQVWLALPGHNECRAMYPDHAFALAKALDQTASEGGERRVFLNEDLSVSIKRKDSNGLLIQEVSSHGGRTAFSAVTGLAAHALARNLENAARQASGGTRASWAA